MSSTCWATYRSPACPDRHISAICRNASPAAATALDGILTPISASDNPLDALPDVVGLVHPDHRDRYAVVLDALWHPDQATEFNGAVRPFLGSAVWALRTTTDYEHAVRAAIDLGGDTDTVAAVTGGLAGVVYGYDAIPSRWTDLLHVPPPGSGGRVLRLHDLVELSDRLGSH